MMPYFNERFGNPSSKHSYGLDAHDAVQNARQRVARVLGCKPNEIIFTSGASEANNMALAIANNIITTEYEHHSVLEAVKDKNTKYIKLDKSGVVDPRQVASLISSDTELVSVMAVNNEIGTMNPIREIAEVCHKNDVLIHCDMTQGILDKSTLNQVNMASFSGHKFGAPKGIGALYIKEGTPIKPLIHGGQQEFGLRAGTENVPYIVALATALEVYCTTDIYAISEMRDRVMYEFSKMPGVYLNGDYSRRCPGILNYRFEGVRGEVLLDLLDQYGIAVSSGSACNSESNEPSHVLTAIGLSEEEANSSIRISLSTNNTMSDVEYVIKTIRNLIELIRGVS